MDLPPSLRPSYRRRLHAEQDERMSRTTQQRKSRSTVNEIRIARTFVLAHVTLEGTMGPGPSQIGYLANWITLHDVDALRTPSTQDCRVR